MNSNTADKMKAIQKIFSQKAMDELPFEMVNYVYNESIRTYKSPIAGLMGVYLLGTMENTDEN